MRGLPAILRDKKWFLIKRRRGVRAGATDTRKKPTTANRYRLEAAIREALRHMPKVYEGSAPLPNEISKFPYDGEQDMFEQEECVDLNGEVHIPRQEFALWYASGKTSASLRPCEMRDDRARNLPCMPCGMTMAKHRHRCDRAKCDTIGRAGFRASPKDPARCSRCDAPRVYKQLYSEENVEHLGPRHQALSALSWYNLCLLLVYTQ